MEKGPDEKAKRKVPADLEELCNAFEDSSYEHFYYLDLDTGEVELKMEDDLDDGDEKGMEDKYAADKYLRVPAADSHEGYRDMEDFARTVKDVSLAGKLAVALDGRGAFRRFKNVLLDCPEERQRWFEFKDGRTKERVTEWLESECIELVAPPPIEITELPVDGPDGKAKIVDGWEGFGPAMCLMCKNERDFKQRLLIISRVPMNPADEGLLKDALMSRYQIEHHGIIAGAFGDKRGLVTSAICGRCGSQDVVFDF
jgi:hypothetical protein